MPVEHPSRQHRPGQQRRYDEHPAHLRLVAEQVKQEGCDQKRDGAGRGEREMVFEAVGYRAKEWANHRRLKSGNWARSARF
jgi:sirohydrochlorin ferrochelatase